MSDPVPEKRIDEINRRSILLMAALSELEEYDGPVEIDVYRHVYRLSREIEEVRARLERRVEPMF